jgi:hypothetical protein
MARVRKSGSVSSRWSIFPDTSFRRAFWSSLCCLWNHLCTQCFHVQILRNNFVDPTFVNIKFIGFQSNCQTQIMATRSEFVFVLAEAGRPDHGSSYIVSHPRTKSLCHRNTWTRDTESLSNAFWAFPKYRQCLPPPDIKFYFITLLEIVLHFCDAVTKCTSTQTKTEPHIFMPASSNLDWG